MLTKLIRRIKRSTPYRWAFYTKRRMVDEACFFRYLDFFPFKTAYNESIIVTDNPQDIIRKLQSGKILIQNLKKIITIKDPGKTFSCEKYKVYFVESAEELDRVLLSTTSHITLVSCRFSGQMPKAYILNNSKYIFSATEVRKSLLSKILLRAELNHRSTLKLFLPPEPLPDISVIITCFNSETYLEKTLNSIIRSDYQRLELIIVDDNSTDGTQGLIKKFISQNPKKKIKFHFNEKNSGTYICRNIGINLATSNWITFQDSDDLSCPLRFQETAYAIATQPDKKAFMGSYRRVDTNQEPLKINNTINLKGLITLTFNKEYVTSTIGFFDSVRFGGDSEFFERLKRSTDASSIGNIDACLYYATMNVNSISSNTFKHIGKKSFFRDIGLDPDRKLYQQRFRAWHQAAPKLFISFPLSERPFEIPSRMNP